jgi:hypothetical protein
VGFFFAPKDMHNYLTYVQQAEDGAFLFRNKLVARPHEPILANLEWWTVGRLSRFLGRRPFLAYALFGIVASFLFVLAADRWLRQAGLPATHRLPALLLVFFGGGLGGLRFRLVEPVPHRCLDLSTGLFPYIEVLANPHFVAGTALLAAGLWALARGGARATLLGLLLAAVLGLVRPYDLAMLVAVRVLAVLLTEPPREWVRRLLPLTALVPVVAYLYVVFFRSGSFAVFSDAAYVFPRLGDFLPALGPAAVLASTAAWAPRAGREPRRFTVHLACWAGLGLLLIVARPVTFSLQFLVGVGLPLLCLGALGLSRLRPVATFLAALAMSTTAVVATHFLFEANPAWYVPSWRVAAAESLRGRCRPGDVLLAPADIGALASGLSACSAFVSHPLAPDSPAREADLAVFYGPATADWRGELLDRHCITHVIVPGDEGEIPAAWLGAATTFRRVALVGRPAAVGLYERPDRGRCGPRAEPAPPRP